MPSDIDPLFLPHYLCTTPYKCCIERKTELETIRGHFMPPQQQLYNGLARLCTTALLHSSGHTRIGTRMDSTAQTVCWPMAIVAVPMPCE